MKNIAIVVTDRSGAQHVMRKLVSVHIEIGSDSLNGMPSNATFCNQEGDWNVSSTIDLSNVKAIVFETE